MFMNRKTLIEEAIPILEQILVDGPVYKNHGICENMCVLLETDLIDNELMDAFDSLGYYAIYPIGENDFISRDYDGVDIDDYGKVYWEHRDKETLWVGKQRELRMALVVQLIEYFKELLNSTKIYDTEIVGWV